MLKTCMPIIRATSKVFFKKKNWSNSQDHASLLNNLSEQGKRSTNYEAYIDQPKELF